MAASQAHQIDSSSSEVLVAYPTAAGFLRDYSRSLSRGWLELEGSHDLAPGTRLKVRLRIPGFPGFDFRAQVAECVAAENSTARARLVYCGPAERLRCALDRHAESVRRRLQSLILADDLALRTWLETLGFQTRPLPDPDQLVAAIARSEVPVVAVLVSPDRAEPYQVAAGRGGARQRVHVIDQSTRLNPLLAAIEEEL